MRTPRTFQNAQQQVKTRNQSTSPVAGVCAGAQAAAINQANRLPRNPAPAKNQRVNVSAPALPRKKSEVHGVMPRASEWRSPVLQRSQPQTAKAKLPGSPRTTETRKFGTPQKHSAVAPVNRSLCLANRQPPATVRGMRPPATSRAVQRMTASHPFASRVIQAVKYYPNLHPGAVEPVEPGNIFKLNSFANQYRLHRANSHSVNVPNQQYNFVRTREGEMLLHARYRHPSIAEGKQVLYAGEIFFNNGQLEWWSNGSGHYQPYADDAEQAALPLDHFFSYQQIIKGEHKRQKG